MIQAIWSPRVCVFTKQVNLRKLTEHRFDVYERALTFDGPAYYSRNGFTFAVLFLLFSPAKRRLHSRKIESYL